MVGEERARSDGGVDDEAVAILHRLHSGLGEHLGRAREWDRGPNMVTELDPDAPLRSGKQLHSLDQADEARLVRALFVLVRCGLLEEGQELCCRVGQVC